MSLMHPRFARRLAGVLRAKKKASGAEATEAWWREVFPRVQKDQILQVKAYLPRPAAPST